MAKASTPTKAPTIALKGWELVHTYHESHGAYVTEIYQRNEDDGFYINWRSSNERVQNMEVTTYLRESRPVSVQTCYGEPSARNYLLARWLRDELIKRPNELILCINQTSLCGTSGSNVYYDTSTDLTYSIFAVAGHGEWVTSISEGRPEGV